jgi:DNA polymerase-3 subunit delta
MIIFLYGPDSFRAREKIKSFKERFVREVDKSGLNLAELEADKININDLNRAIATQSFLSNKRMVIIKNVLLQKKNFQAELLELLKKGNYRESKEDNILIFYDEKPDKRLILFKYLLGSKFKEEFEALVGEELTAWIVARVKLSGGEISAANANLLASKSDGNLWALNNEINKLRAESSKGEISEELIAESYLFKLEENIFALTDALGNKNKIQALKLITAQLESGVEAIYLLSMIARQFRIIIQVKSVLEKGERINYRAMGSELGLHPFVVQKTLPMAGKYTMPELKNIYEKILWADKQLKSGREGKLALQMLLLEI